MSKVDFYLLNQQVPNGKLRAACRVSQKIYSLGHKSIILVTDMDQARTLDDLMWTFEQGSFLPHGLQGDTGDNPDTPILISCRQPDGNQYDVLISLQDTVPDCFNRYGRVAEIVDQVPIDKDQARERYRHYREQGCSLETHDIHP